MKLAASSGRKNLSNRTLGPTHNVQTALSYITHALSLCEKYPCGPHKKEDECDERPTCELHKASAALARWLEAHYPRRKLKSRPGDAMDIMLFEQKHRLEKK